MHPAWHIEDIQYLIFELLDPQDFCKLAQICNSLFHASTDYAWKTLTSPSAFIRCLPEDYRRRPLKTEDLRRLDFYASKVRSISFNHTAKDGLPEEFWLPNQKRKDCISKELSKLKSWEQLWSEIAAMRPTTTFLPNLRKIHIHHVPEHLLLALVGTSGCTLEYIAIESVMRNIRRAKSSGKTIIYELLDHLQDTSKLEHLSLAGGESSLVLPRLINRSPLRHLRLDSRVFTDYMNFHSKTFSMPPEILEKSMLKSLSLTLTRDWLIPQLEELIQKRKYFAALETLQLDLKPFRAEECSRTCENVDGWTCFKQLSRFHIGPSSVIDCGRRPPTVFLEGLDRPELRVLKIIFPTNVTEPMLLKFLSTAQASCCLQNLEYLALAGGGQFDGYPERDIRPSLNIKPAGLRDGLKMYLPMPRLKYLQLSVAPRFLDVLDFDLYASMTAGLPSLEELQIGNVGFCNYFRIDNSICFEKTILHHLAAFCHMLPNIKRVGVACVDAIALESNPTAAWASPSITTITVYHWAGTLPVRGIDRNLLEGNLRVYFPCSDLGVTGFTPDSTFFHS